MKASYIEDFDQWKREFTFSAPVQVRFSETDMFGHVNNTVPIAYFEFARIEFMKEMGLPYSEGFYPYSVTIFALSRTWWK